MAAIQPQIYADHHWYFFYEAVRKCPFFQTRPLYSTNYTRNINYMSAVIYWASLDFGKKRYSRTASYYYHIQIFWIPVFCRNSRTSQE